MEANPKIAVIANVRVKVVVSEVIQNINGITIVEICIVMVFVATACTRNDFGTTFAVNADLAGWLITLVADSNAVAK